MLIFSIVSKETFYFKGFWRHFVSLQHVFAELYLYLIIYLFRTTLQEESAKRADVFGKTPSQNKKTPSRMCVEHASAVLKRGIDTEPCI